MSERENEWKLHRFESIWRPIRDFLAKRSLNLFLKLFLTKKPQRFDVFNKKILSTTIFVMLYFRRKFLVWHLGRQSWCKCSCFYWESADSSRKENRNFRSARKKIDFDRLCSKSIRRPDSIGLEGPSRIFSWPNLNPKWNNVRRSTILRLRSNGKRPENKIETSNLCSLIN